MSRKRALKKRADFRKGGFVDRKKDDGKGVNLGEFAALGGDAWAIVNNDSVDSEIQVTDESAVFLELSHLDQPKGAPGKFTGNKGGLGDLADYRKPEKMAFLTLEMLHVMPL